MSGEQTAPLPRGVELEDAHMPLLFGTKQAWECIDRKQLSLPDDVVDYELHFYQCDYAMIDLMHKDGRKTQHLLGQSEDGIFEPVHEITPMEVLIGIDTGDGLDTSVSVMRNDDGSYEVLDIKQEASQS